MAFFSVEMGMEQVGLIQPNMAAVTTGISAKDRAHTIRVAAAPGAKADQTNRHRICT